MLWIDKYRPKQIDDLILNKDIGQNLRNLVANGDCPHLLFYGPPGAGKKTLILALLREIYGAGAEKVKVETRPWKIQLPSRTLEVELTTSSSNYHVEMNPSDVGNNDRYVVQELIKEMAKSRPLDVRGQKGFKVLVLNETDRLSREAQHSLRRTMEKYSAACRLVLACSNISKVIDPVRSRCLCIRVAAPRAPQVEQLLSHVARKESVALPEPLLHRLSAASERNLRRALLMLETCRVAQQPLTPDQELPFPDWELYIKEIARDMLEQQTPKQVYIVRGKLYELLVNCLPPELIFRQLCRELMAKLDDQLKYSCAFAAAQCEHRLQEGSKAIFHLEAFVARFMADYKTYLISAMG